MINLLLCSITSAICGFALSFTILNTQIGSQIKTELLRFKYFRAMSVNLYSADVRVCHICLSALSTICFSFISMICFAHPDILFYFGTLIATGLTIGVLSTIISNPDWPVPRYTWYSLALVWIIYLCICPEIYVYPVALGLSYLGSLLWSPEL